MKKILILVLAIFSTTIIQAQTDLKLNKADSLFNIGKYKDAIYLYSEIIDEPEITLTNKKYYSYFQRANCYYFLLDYDKSLKDIGIACKADTNLMGHNSIIGHSLWLHGRIQSKLDNKEESLNLYLEATKYIKEQKLYTNIGYKQIQLENYEEAIFALNFAINLDSTDAYAFNNRALAYLKINNFKNAELDVLKSIKLNPNNPYAFKTNALLLIEQRKITMACEQLKIAEEKGYYFFGNESDKEEVILLQKKYCN